MLLGEVDCVVPEIGQAAGWELGDSGSPFGFGAVTWGRGLEVPTCFVNCRSIPLLDRENFNQ